MTTALAILALDMATSTGWALLDRNGNVTSGVQRFDLARGESVQAVSALHDLARLPNREIALATADVVQRRLGADLGLQRGQPLPPVHSRKAAEVARQLMIWALQQEAPEDEAAARATGLTHDDGEW